MKGRLFSGFILLLILVCVASVGALCALAAVGDQETEEFTTTAIVLGVSGGLALLLWIAGGIRASVYGNISSSAGVTTVV